MRSLQFVAFACSCPLTQPPRKVNFFSFCLRSSRSFVMATSLPPASTLAVPPLPTSAPSSGELRTGVPPLLPWPASFNQTRLSGVSPVRFCGPPALFATSAWRCSSGPPRGWCSSGPPRGRCSSGPPRGRCSSNLRKASALQGLREAGVPRGLGEAGVSWGPC